VVVLKIVGILFLVSIGLLVDWVLPTFLALIKRGCNGIGKR